MLSKAGIMLVILLVSGCATITSHNVDHYQKNSFYAGTQLDYHTLHDCFFCALDLPLSMVGDTLMLPFDTWWYYHTPEDKTKS